MSTEVIDINERRPYLSGMVQCMHCGHKHVAVAPVGTHWQECPECHTMMAVWVNPIERGTETWECRCGGIFFRCNRQGPYCARCGVYQKLPTS